MEKKIWLSLKGILYKKYYRKVVLLIVMGLTLLPALKSAWGEVIDYLPANLPIFESKRNDVATRTATGYCESTDTYGSIKATARSDFQCPVDDTINYAEVDITRDPFGSRGMKVKGDVTTVPNSVHPDTFLVGIFQKRGYCNGATFVDENFFSLCPDESQPRRITSSGTLDFQAHFVGGENICTTPGISGDCPPGTTMGLSGLCCEGTDGCPTETIPTYECSNYI